LIDGTAHAMPRSQDWRSEGEVFGRDRLGSFLMIQHLEGANFQNRQLAESDGLELCKKWIDEKKSE